MSIRRGVRHGLLSLDSRLGIRKWLREPEANAGEAETPKFSDPFALSEVPHPRPKTVLDVGASHGQFANDALRVFPGITIYSFEPIPECYEELIALAKEQPTVHPINLAISDHEGEQDLWLSSFRDSSSLQQMLPAHVQAWPHTAIEKKITVKVTQLDSATAGLQLEEPIFAKIDVQGHELAVIRGGRQTLGKCERLMLECNFAPLYAGQPTFSQLYDELRSLGFLFDGFLSPLRHPQTLELLSADAVFFRPQESVAPKSS
jgi:FkbM family methyltransferase